MEKKILSILKELKFGEKLVNEAHKEIMDLIEPKEKIVDDPIIGTMPPGTEDVCKLCKYNGFCEPEVFAKCWEELEPNEYYK